MLSHMLKGIPIPIIITGSQLSISNPVADAYENMRLSFYMAKNNILEYMLYLIEK